MSVSTRFCRLVAFVALPLLVAGPGCVSRNVESISAEDAAAIGAPSEPVDPTAAVAGEPEMPGIEGTIALGEGVSAPAGGVLFVIVRVSGRESGPPIAVQQLPAGLPASFRITAADSMIPNTPLVGDLDVIARFDQDGNAFSREPGDLEGRSGPVVVGDTVEIVLGPADTEAAGASGQ